jgi:hypothetical protein
MIDVKDTPSTLPSALSNLLVVLQSLHSKVKNDRKCEVNQNLAGFGVNNRCFNPALAFVLRHSVAYAVANS